MGQDKGGNIMEIRPDLAINDAKKASGNYLEVKVSNNGAKESDPAEVELKVYDSITDELVYTGKKKLPGIAPQKIEELKFKLYQAKTGSEIIGEDAELFEPGEIEALEASLSQLTPGPYRYNVVLDPDNKINESEEGNNVKSGSFWIDL